MNKSKVPHLSIQAVYATYIIISSNNLLLCMQMTLFYFHKTFSTVFSTIFQPLISDSLCYFCCAMYDLLLWSGLEEKSRDEGL